MQKPKVYTEWPDGPLHFRWDVMNYLIEKRGYKRYLEIGVCGHDKESSNLGGVNYTRIRVEHKDGIDPMGKPANYVMTSDAFFRDCADDKLWDIIFIDGNHLYSQVVRDMVNAFNHLSDDGIIIMHDAFPADCLLNKNRRVKAIFSHAWCAIADYSLCRTDLKFYMLEAIHPYGLEPLCIIDKTARRTIPNVPFYKSGKPVSWTIIADRRYIIFDQVIDLATFVEMF